MKPQYKEIDLGKFTPAKNEYEMAVPFAIAFVYSKKGNFIIKGMEILGGIFQNLNGNRQC